MTVRRLRVWYDSDGDSLEVAWDVKDGHFEETDDERLLERVDSDGNTIGFMIEGLATLDSTGPVDVDLGGPRAPEHITTVEASVELGVSLRRVQQLLSAGRIEGAERFGRVWAIPSPVRIVPGKRGPVGVAGERSGRVA